MVIKDGDAIVATSHFIGDKDDPLWRFSDSGMHSPCFLSWPLRESFVLKYNTAVGALTAGNGTYHHMEANGQISVLKRSAES
jgi:hypothetical protein